MKQLLVMVMVSILALSIVGCGDNNSDQIPVHKDPVTGTQYTFTVVSTNYRGTPKSTGFNFLRATTVYADNGLAYEMTQGNIEGILSYMADQIEGNSGLTMNKTDMKTRLNDMASVGYLPFVSFAYSDVITTTNSDGTTTSTCTLTATSGVDTSGKYSGTAGQAISFSQHKQTKMSYDAANDRWVIFSEINLP